MKKVTIVLFLLVIAFGASAQSTPTASFKVNTTIGCSPLAVDFTNTSVNAVSYYWDFGNGNFSTLVNPSNVYSATGTYTIKLIAVDANGQKDSIISTQLIKVVADISADFYVNNPASCLNGNVISFINTSSNSTSWLWDFGDGNTSTLQHPTHSYSQAGIYTIQLLASNVAGCSNLRTIKNLVQIYAKPTGAFTVNITASCDSNQSFHFTNTSSGAINYLWDFGDGATSSLSSPNHVYHKSGVYNVSLIASNANGCDDTLMKKNFITVFPSEIFSFSVDKTIGCAPLAVAFVPNASATVINYLWNFGDGDTSTTKQPIHTYQKTGNYDVGLTITMANNCNYSKTSNSLVKIKKNDITAKFNVSDTMGLAPLKVQFINTSINSNSWQWNFGDGDTSSAQSPTHFYKKKNNYTVVLNAYNSIGCNAIYQLDKAVRVIDTIANFNADITKGCAPLSVHFTNLSFQAVKWIWDFGDGTTSTQEHPIHTYSLPGNYTVSLIAFNAKNQSDTIIFKSYIHIINPNVSYTTPPTITGCAPLTTSFSDATQGVSSWSWNFGDGKTSTLQNPSHTYNEKGFYTVSLTIQIAGGCTQVYSKFRTFNVEGGRAGFSLKQDSIIAPATVYFKDTSQNAASWKWNFGDSTVSTLQNPSHTYTLPGYYTVILTVKTLEGCANTVVHYHAVNVSDYSKLNIDTSKNGGVSSKSILDSSAFLSTDSLRKITGCVPLSIKFNPDISGTSWNWNFGDGETSSLKTPLHIYTKQGTYSVTLTLRDSTGKIDTILYVVKAGETVANFSVVNDTLNNCQNNNITLLNTSTDAASWNWNFGDGSFSTLQNPKHTYLDTSNNYNITLTTTNAYGCSDMTVKSIFIGNENPVVADDYNVCTNQAVQFHCYSPNYISYVWTFGDGDTSFKQNPEHEYVKGGSFQAKLFATDKWGCPHQYIVPNPIVVHHVVADFSFDKTGGCDLSMKFTNLSTGVDSITNTSYLIYWGDNALNYVTTPTLTHKYSQQGSFNVTLRAFYDYAFYYNYYYAHGGKKVCESTVTKTVQVLPSLVADFSFTQNSTCFPITATYYDSSKNAVSWFWNFGDGNTSTKQNPVHTFSSLPSSQVTLTVTDSNGCQAVITKPNITVFSTDFSVAANNGCAPFNAAFTDQSLHATTWFWNFGNGDTSTLQNPTHTFIYEGTYSVSLISQTANGCVDTAFHTITVHHPMTNFASFTPASCAPALVSFADSSVRAVSWLWDFGDGISSTEKNPKHIYSTPNLYSITLSVTDSFGCSDTLKRINYQKVLGPVAAFSVISVYSCTQVSAQFTDSSFGATSWNWNFGDGSTSSLQNPLHLYKDTGQFSISLIVHDSLGCQANYDLPNNIIFTPLPTADFTTDNTIGCAPFSVTFHSQSKNAVNYLWNFNNGDTSTLQNPMVTFNTSGTYSVSCIATDSRGCTDSITKPSFIHIGDSDTPPVSKIIVATVLSDTSTSIIWTPATINDFAYYTIFRKNPVTQQYIVIDTIKDINIASYTDRQLNTLKYSYCYKVQTMDICGNALPMESLEEHCTINVTAKGEGDNIKVSWTHYIGAEVHNYKVYRMEIGNPTAVLIATVTSDISSILDISIGCPVSYSYRIKACNLNGNFISSNSDTSVAMPANHIFDKLKVEVVRSTVINNESVLTEWNTPLGANVVTSYNIYRAVDNLNFSLLATLPALAHEYIDKDVNVHEQNYYYKIVAVNSCGIAGVEGNKGSSILLTAEFDENSKLNWTNYDGWELGVDYFVIEKLNDDGKWETIKVVDGKTLKYEDK